MQIKEFADFSGVSVRTLHYYDEIGLLKPAFVEKTTGYRFYDEKSFLRMQEILFYRELDFSLKSIGEILSSPNYDKSKALKEQKQLLILKKERLERLISAIDSAVKGENVMNAFDNSEFEKHKAEAREKWGKTDAYKEYEEKSKNRTKEQEKDLGTQVMDFFARLGSMRPCDPAAPEAQAWAKQLQDFFTENYYTCTPQILSSLAESYAGGGSMTENIDKVGGAGTGAFAKEVIVAYLKNS